MSRTSLGLMRRKCVTKCQETETNFSVIWCEQWTVMLGLTKTVSTPPNTTTFCSTGTLWKRSNFQGPSTVKLKRAKCYLTRATMQSTGHGFELEQHLSPDLPLYWDEKGLIVHRLDSVDDIISRFLWRTDLYATWKWPKCLNEKKNEGHSLLIHQFLSIYLTKYKWD